MTFALTPVAMKCFERFVMDHIKSLLPASMDPLQFAYRANQSTEDGMSALLHLTLAHLEDKNTYARILLVDFSSAFNTVCPQQLVEKLQLLGVGTSTCNWVLDFLTERRQTVKTHDCTANHNTSHIIKFANNTTVVGLIRNDERAHRDEVKRLMTWCNLHYIRSLTLGRPGRPIILH